jgi:redox-sensing transcriptional repressor
VRGFEVVGLLDADPGKVGQRVGALVVESMDDLPRVVAERDVAIAIVAVPADAAQVVADQLVEAGVTAVLNFAPKVVSVPDHVTLRKVDLAIELQILSFYEQRLGPSGLIERETQVPLLGEAAV